MLAMSIHFKRRKVDKVILAKMCYFVSHILANFAPSPGNSRAGISYHPWPQLPNKTDLILSILCTFIMHVLKSQPASSFVTTEALKARKTC
jgi:hypothetical protein